MSMILQLIAVFVQSFCLAAILWCGWSMVCANRTSSDLNKVLAAIRYRPMTGPTVLLELQRVTFLEHYRARIFCRNPWNLYGPVVLDAIQNPRSEVIGIVPGEPSDTPPAVH